MKISFETVTDSAFEEYSNIDEMFAKWDTEFTTDSICALRLVYDKQVNTGLLSVTIFSDGDPSVGIFGGEYTDSYPVKNLSDEDMLKLKEYVGYVVPYKPFGSNTNFFGGKISDKDLKKVKFKKKTSGDVIIIDCY